MFCYSITNIDSRKVIGFLYWEKSKNVDELLDILELKCLIRNGKNYYVNPEHHGLFYSIKDKTKDDMVMFLTLQVTEMGTNLIQ